MQMKSLGGAIKPLLLAVWLGLPAAAPAAPAPDLPAPADRFALPAPKANRVRPLIAILVDKDGAQTTDFAMPYGILKESAVADVRSVSTRDGPIRLTRGLTIRADETLAAFDARESAGADIVIVPAQAHPDDVALASWLRGQAAKGVVIVSVCEGARLLARAGLLDGKRAVTHWASLETMARSYKGTSWERDRRYLQDGAVITTAGVTASIPMSLALVEAIGGHQIAVATAARFGVESWGPAHRTADFAIGKADRETAAAASRQPGETTEIPIGDGVDEVSLALQAEAWGRSGRTRVVTTRIGGAPVRSRHSLVILPDAEPARGSHVVEPGGLPAIAQLDATLAEMGRRYGAGAIRLAILGMEYDPAAP